MAIVLDMNILCNKIIDFGLITSVLTKYRVSMESVNCIDNWKWDNEKKIEPFQQIVDVLHIKHIVIIKLRHPKIKDMEICIE